MANMELIDRKALGIGRCNPDVFPAENLPYVKGWNAVIELLEQAPTIDAVPVVRCQYCQHWHPSGWCKLIGQEFDRWPAYYCAEGIRKDKEGFE